MTSAPRSPRGGDGPDVDIDAVAAAVLAVPGISALVAGSPEQVVTYLPGRRVEGVRVDGDTLTVAVRAGLDVPLPELAGEVRRAVAASLAGTAVGRTDVVVADLDDPADARDPDGLDDPDVPAAVRAVP